LIWIVFCEYMIKTKIMRKFYIIFYLCFISITAFTQTSDTLKLSERKFMKGDTWEWKIENWDSNKNCDLVIDYNFYSDGIFIKYQRVETPTKPYNEVKKIGHWVRNGADVSFSIETENIRTECEFNADINPTVFKIKTYKLGKLLKSINQEYVKLPYMKIFDF